MTTPRRGQLFHFTHINNLESIIVDGIHCDNYMTTKSKPFDEVGNLNIKARRRQRRVPIEPRGTVADYVPFYFAARSPMLYSIHKGNVKGYSGGQDEVVYLVTDTTVLKSGDLRCVFTDRNAALLCASYSSDIDMLDTFVDWPLMEAAYFYKTDHDPGRPARRMAELLVHQHVPWSALLKVATLNESRTSQAEAILANVGAETRVQTLPGWYFS